MTQNKFEDGSPLILHLELLNEWCEKEDKQLLVRHADATDRGTITRTIIIPEDMPLHNLHYAIQRLFGWQNSHLRSFYMDEEDFKRLTEERVHKWSVLVGLLFKGIPEDTDDQFWDDDYTGGSIKTWFRKKYTGPYIYKGYTENHDVAQQYVQDFFQRVPIIEVKESFHDYYERNKGKSEKDKSPIQVIKRARIEELTIKELNDSIIFDTRFDELLERVKVKQVLGAEGDKLSSYTELLESQLTGCEFKPVTKSLIYNYDYGDSWRVKIKRYKHPIDLIDRGLVDEQSFCEAIEKVKKKHKPVCIHKKGGFVMDDVGGMSGFTNFMHIIYLGEDAGEKKDTLQWAKSMGWSSRKVELSKML